MLDLLTADTNIAFTVALLVMLAIALLEGLALVLGAGISSTLDALLPDTDLHLEHGEVDSSHGLSRVLGWMHIGEVPALIVLIVLLTTFGLVGLSMQSTLSQTFGFMLPVSIALLTALPLARVFTGLLTKPMRVTKAKQH